MNLYNARIYRGDGGLAAGRVEIEGGTILRIADERQPARPSTADLDAGGLIVAPGFIDLQINGGFGCDFTTDPETIWEVAAKLPRYGVTGFLPTIITAAGEAYRRAMAVLRQGPPPGFQGARVLGLHFEGPFLNPAKKGAHDPLAIHAPDPDFAREWSRENGVALVTLAPEQPGALELAGQLAARGILLSAGHTMATLDDAHIAAGHGFRAVTHLFNAMPPLDHRSPGLVAAALLDPRLTPSIIPDGVHVHPEMVNLAWRLKGPNGLALITDAVGALGVPPGEYVQGGMEIVVDEKAARLKNGTLAGSILGLDQALRNLMAYTGDPLERILPALAETQARLLGLADLGAVRPGFRADLVLLDDEGRVAQTMVGGAVVYSR